MAKLKVKFHPIFLIFLLLLAFSNNIFGILSYLLCVFLHELGHFFVANHYGYKLNKVTFMPFGASLSGTENVFYNLKHEILISIAGPFVNLISIVLCLALFWCYPITYAYLQDFFYANLVTLIFNFLPVYPLDGGRVIFALTKTKLPIKKAYRIIKIIGLIVSILLFVLFIISSFFKINYTFGTTSVFLLAGLFFDDKSGYYVTNFSLINKHKKLKCGIETMVLSIHEDSNLYTLLKKLNKYKYNLVNIISSNGKIIKSLSEEEINGIFINNPLNLCLKDVNI